MRHLAYLRWVVPLVLVSWVVWQSALAAQPVVATTGFTERTPLVDVLLPAARAEASPEGAALLREPVYVDVTLPPRAFAATLELTVSASSAPLKLGVQQGPGWDISFSEAQAAEQGGERRYTLRVPQVTHLEPGYRLRFVVSAPELVPGEIVVTGARVTIERQPFSLAWLALALRGVNL